MSIFSPCFPCFSPCCCIFTRFFPCFFQHFAPHGPTARPMAEAPGHGLSGAAATRGMAEADAVAVQRLHSGCAMECTEGSVCCGGKAMGKLWKRYPGWWFQTFFIFHNVWDNHDHPSHWLVFFKMVKTTNQYQYLRDILGISFMISWWYSILGICLWYLSDILGIFLLWSIWMIIYIQVSNSDIKSEIVMIK